MSSDEQRLPLDLLPAAIVRRRARLVAVIALVLGAGFGGMVGFFGGRLAGLITAVVFAVPLLLLAFSESRRRVWLIGSVVEVKALASRRVDLRTAAKLDMLVTDTRGVRTVGLLATGPPKGKTVNLALATYAGTGGRELGVLQLRRLADLLAGVGDTRGLVFSELLIAQLRSEARGDGASDRPLHRLASMAPQGRLAQKLNEDAVSRFVALLD